MITNPVKTGLFLPSKPKKNPRSSRQDSDAFGEGATNSAYWHLHSVGNYIYGARGSAGVNIVDASTPTALNEVFSSFHHETDESTTVGYRCMGIGVTGNTMVSVARSGAYETTGIGYIETWDITIPSGTTVIDVYTKNSSDALEASPHLYSAVVADGNYAYVSGQKSGFWIFDISGATITPSGSITSGLWETQGLCKQGNYVYCANYGYGIVSIDVTIPASPAVQDALGAYTSGPNGDTLRPWDCIADGDYLYCSVNTSGAAGDSVDRGLVVADISNPANLSWTGYCNIPEADQDTWNGSGDRPYLGIEKFQNYVFIGSGQKGVFVFDVSTPTQPKYCGIVAVPDAGDNIYAVTIMNDGGIPYLVYADGANGTSGSKKLYIDKIHIR